MSQFRGSGIFARRFVPVFVIAVLALGSTSPAVTAARLKLHTDQQMIEAKAPESAAPAKP
jgi:hypothetical protein